MKLRLVGLFIDQENPENTKRVFFDVETDFLYHHSCGMNPKILKAAEDAAGQTQGLIGIEFSLRCLDIPEDYTEIEQESFGSFLPLKPIRRDNNLGGA